MEYNDEVYNLLRYAGKLRSEDIFYYPMQFVLRNLRSVASMSIYELADASFVSPATISRMCRDLGYKNYQEFKSSVYAAYRRAVQSVETDQPYRVARNDTESFDTAIALNYLDQCRAGLDFCESFVRSDSYEKQLAMMHKAENFFIFSTTNQDVYPLQNKLILSGKFLTMYYGSGPEVMERIRTDLNKIQRACCLFLIHTQEEYDAFLPVIESLKEKDATVILFHPVSVRMGRDDPKPDLAVSFPAIGSISDETFFSGYLTSLTIAL